MSLSPGTRLGPYEIVALLGAGGMGAVYKARDQRLGRDVAVKVVATDRADDAALLARLEQEARTAASLNHPNIVAVFDVGTHDGAPYIVSELLDGETLRERLAAGPLPVRKAIEFVCEVADGLAAAHARAVVHRDLKPENIFLTEGRAKILDFGLAKSGPEGPSQVSDAATVVQTLPGVVMGTVGYMSPEQVAGRPVDHRTDIFSLGTVFHEMLTGQRAFQRATAAESMVAILKEEPAAPSMVNASVPAVLDRIVQRCLQKAPAARFQSASDLSFALTTVPASSGHAIPPATATARRSSRPWALAVMASIAAVAFTALGWYVAKPTGERAPGGLKHFIVDMQSTPLSESSVPLALSPDGTKLVFSVGSFQGSQLFLRSLDQPGAKLIPGTLDAWQPFFSPDSQWVGFFTGSELRKAPVSGGPVVTITSAAGLFRGGATWSTDGTIYFTRYSALEGSGTTKTGIFSVSAGGGEVRPVTTLASDETAHRQPALLPGERAVLFTVSYGRPTGMTGATFQRATKVAVRSLDSGAQRTLIEDASFARYVPTGHLLYVKGDSLLAVPFDVRRLELSGPPVVVSSQVAVNSDGTAQLAVSSDGILAYVERGSTDRRSLVWVDRQGSSSPTTLGFRSFDTPRLAPDGGRIAALVREKGQADVWVQERTSGALSRLTFDGVQTGLIWTPDGREITFSTMHDDKPAIASQEVDGDRPTHEVAATGRGVWPGSWSRDGQTLAFMDSGNAGDVSAIRRGTSEVTPFVNTRATEWGARLSPDDRWMAYTSNESGHWEVYVKPFPGPGARRQISTDGGAEIVWSRNGRELFYRNGAKLMAVDIETQPVFSAGTPHLLFEGPFVRGQPGLPGYDVSVDGRRFLMVKPDEAEATQRPIHVVINWFDELRRLTATAR